MGADVVGWQGASPTGAFEPVTDLPEGPGDAQSPEWLLEMEVRAQEVYAARMWAFEENTRNRRPWRKRRGDYERRNCEEARALPKAGNVVGRQLV